MKRALAAAPEAENPPLKSPRMAKRSTSKPAIAEPPRAVEVLWDGRAAPGFTLKRRRCGAILVSSVAAAESAELRVGSELRLVAGFPVNRLTLKAVKKVMLGAPKPVSLVFVNADELQFLADEDKEQESTRMRKHSTVSVESSSAESVASSSATSRSMSVESSSSSGSGSGSSSRRRHRRHRNEGEGADSDTKAKKRKVSKLQVALDRVNQLLNRPVRQSGLNIPASQSIVV